VQSNSAPEQGTTFFAEGAKLIIHIEDDSNVTNYDENYDRWYHTELRDGNSVYKLTKSQLSAVSTSPYKYTVSSGGESSGSVVHWTSGTTNYWDVGKLAIYPRLDNDDLTVAINYGATCLASMTDGITEVDTQGEETADATLATDTDVLTFSITPDRIDGVWGLPFYSISQNGEFQERVVGIIISSNMTALKMRDGKGWNSLGSNLLYAESGFYTTWETPDSYIPTAGSKMPTISITIPLDCSGGTGSTAYSIKLWINEFALQSNVASGQMSTSMPTVYGIADFGPTAPFADETFTTSSGAGATETLLADITLPA
jgi:hypothetical protein